MIDKGDEHLPLLNRLKEYRSRLGVNQTEMGKLALKIAKICEVSVEDIFIYEEEINDEGKEK